MFFGRKTKKLKDVFMFATKFSFFSNASLFFFSVANHQSSNEGLSAIKKVSLLKGAFSGLSQQGVTKIPSLNTLSIEKFLIYG